MKLLETKWVKKDPIIRNFFIMYSKDLFYILYSDHCYKFGIVVEDDCCGREVILPVPGGKYSRLYFTTPRYFPENITRECVVEYSSDCLNVYGEKFLGSIRCAYLLRERDMTVLDYYNMAMCCSDTLRELIHRRLEKGCEGLIYEEKIKQ